MKLAAIIFRVTTFFVLGSGILWHPSVLAQTGDSTVDGWIYYYDQRGGNNTAPASLQAANYTAFYKCNSAGAPSWEQNCPSDLTYTPGSNGGYQAYGVGNTEIPGGNQWYIICYWHWYLDPFTYEPVWEWHCDYYDLGYVPETTYGVAGARIKWSTEYEYDAVAGFFPLSTVALKGAVSHTGSNQFDCNPEVNGLDFGSRPCDTGLQDRYIVPYAGYEGTDVGYEDKVRLQDPNCPYNRQRTDTTADRDVGCFAAFDTAWWSDLPGAYIDTTAFDVGVSPGTNYFIPAVGTTDVASIQEGQVYGWRRSFWTWGLDNASGTTQHWGGITIYSGLPPCYFGNDPALCQFQVDQTRIGPDSTVN